MGIGKVKSLLLFASISLLLGILLKITVTTALMAAYEKGFNAGYSEFEKAYQEVLLQNHKKDLIELEERLEEVISRQREEIEEANRVKSKLEAELRQTAELEGRIKDVAEKNTCQFISDDAFRLLNAFLQEPK